MQTLINDSIDQTQRDAAVIPAPDLSMLPGFSPADLVDNRAGRLSPTQRDERASDIGEKTALSLLGLALFLAIPIVQGNWLFAGMGAIGAIVVVARWWKGHDELTAGVVALAEGDARTRHIPGGEDPDEWHLYINGLELQTEKAVHHAFQPGGPYRVYYLPNTLTVVSAEPLSGWRYTPPPVAQKARPWWSHFSIALGG